MHQILEAHPQSFAGHVNGRPSGTDWASVGYNSSPEDAHLAIKPRKQISRNPFKLALAGMATAAMYTGIVQQGPASAVVTPDVASVQHTTAAPVMEEVTSRSITIYGDEPTRAKLEAVTDRFPELWTDRGQTIDTQVFDQKEEPP